jgi:hypothetical protein
VAMLSSLFAGVDECQGEVVHHSAGGLGCPSAHYTGTMQTHGHCHEPGIRACAALAQCPVRLVR